MRPARYNVLRESAALQAVLWAGSNSNWQWMLQNQVVAINPPSYAGAFKQPMQGCWSSASFLQTAQVRTSSVAFDKISGSLELMSRDDLVLSYWRESWNGGRPNI